MTFILTGLALAAALVAELAVEVFGDDSLAVPDTIRFGLHSSWPCSPSHSASLSSEQFVIRHGS